MNYKQQFWYKFLIWVVRPFMKIFYRYEVHGIENIPSEGKYIICANHSSCADPILLVLAIRKKVYFMAKDELFQKKLIAKFLTAFGAFPVKRGSRDSSALDTSEEVLNHDNPLGIFIEGTRSKDGEFLKPKAGAALIAKKTSTSILPICLTNIDKGPVKAFHKTSIDIGKIIPCDELGIENEKGSELRDAIRKVMNEIISLRNNMQECEKTKNDTTC